MVKTYNIERMVKQLWPKVIILWSMTDLVSMKTMNLRKKNVFFMKIIDRSSLFDLLKI